MNLFNECQQELHHLLGEINELHGETSSLMLKAQEVSTFGVDGIGIKSSWQGTDKKFKRLILRIKYKAEELNMFSDQRIFSEQQADIIRELWSTILAKIQSTSSMIKDAINILRSKNFLVDVVLWFEELWESFQTALRVAGKVIIQGVALVLGESIDPIFLPNSEE